MLYCMCVHSKVIVGYDPTKQPRRFSFQFWIRALGLLWCRNCDILTRAKGPWVCFSLFCREMLNKLLSVILPMWGVKSLIHSPHGMESHSVIPRSCQNIIAMHIVDHPGLCSYLKAYLFVHSSCLKWLCSQDTALCCHLYVSCSFDLLFSHQHRRDLPDVWDYTTRGL